MLLAEALPSPWAILEDTRGAGFGHPPAGAAAQWHGEGDGGITAAGAWGELRCTPGLAPQVLAVLSSWGQGWEAGPSCC